MDDHALLPTGDGPARDPDPPVRDPMSVSEAALRLAEAMLFASDRPVGARALSQVLDADSDADAVLAALAERYAGRGVEVVEVAGGWQFRTAEDLAPALRKVVAMPRRLPRAAMETLAIVAYHQPVTRAEIEEIRGATLSQATMDALLEAGLIAARGRKEAPGRPTLWATTPAFLTQFGLKDLRDLPRREDLVVEPPGPATAHAVAESPDGSATPDDAAEGADVAERPVVSEADEAAEGAVETAPETVTQADAPSVADPTG